MSADIIGTNFRLIFEHINAANEAAALTFSGAVIIYNDVGAPTFRTYQSYLFLNWV